MSLQLTGPALLWMVAAAPSALVMFARVGANSVGGSHPSSKLSGAS